MGVSHGSAIENPALVAAHGLRQISPLVADPLGGPVFTTDHQIAGIHLGSNAGLGTHPNQFVPAVVIQQLLRFRAGKGFNRVVSNTQLSNAFDVLLWRQPKLRRM